MLGAKQIALTAEMHSVDCKLGLRGELGPALAAGLYTCAAIRNFDERSSELSRVRYMENLLEGFVSVNVEGRIWILPSDAGLGVKVKREKLQPCPLDARRVK